MTLTMTLTIDKAGFWGSQSTKEPSLLSCRHKRKDTHPNLSVPSITISAGLNPMCNKGTGVFMPLVCREACPETEDTAGLTPPQPPCSRRVS